MPSDAIQKGRFPGLAFPRPGQKGGEGREATFGGRLTHGEREDAVKHRRPRRHRCAWATGLRFGLSREVIEAQGGRAFQHHGLAGHGLARADEDSIPGGKVHGMDRLPPFVLGLAAAQAQRGEGEEVLEGGVAFGKLVA